MNKKGCVGNCVEYSFLDFVQGLIGGIIIGLVLMALIYEFANQDVSYLSKDTANEICSKLTDNNATIGSSDSDGNLVCTKPSYDHTDKIIIRNNGDVK